MNKFRSILQICETVQKSGANWCHFNIPGLQKAARSMLHPKLHNGANYSRRERARHSLIHLIDSTRLLLSCVRIVFLFAEDNNYIVQRIFLRKSDFYCFANGKEKQPMSADGLEQNNSRKLNKASHQSEGILLRVYIHSIRYIICIIGEHLITVRLFCSKPTAWDESVRT